MTTMQALAALASVGQLVLVLVVLLRGTGSPLTLPLALFCLDLFTWNAAALAFDLSGHTGWHWLDLSTSPLTAPLALDFVLAFVGQRRRWRGIRLAAWAVLGLFAGLSSLSFFLPRTAAFAGSDWWALLLLGGSLPIVGFAVALLVAHLRGTVESEEIRRTYLLLAALGSGLLLASTELWGHFLPGFPGLAPLGLLIASTLTTLAAMRLRLLEHTPPLSALAAALAIAGAGVAAYLALFSFVGGNSALLFFGTAAVSLGLMAATRQLSGSSARRRASLSQLATMGRFSQQLAHDLKNPLAAMKGAAQFLQESLAREGGSASNGRFVQLMLDQVERIHRTIERYQRLAQLVAERAPLELNEVVREVLALQQFATQGRISVHAELGELPGWSGDRELLATALENLLSNAFEAMPSQGTVTVRTSASASELLLSVEDEGPGMDARTRERAFDELFTTKPSGSGLGLSFVRRVAEAHGGSATLGKRTGRGTLVTMRLPLQ